MQFIIINKILFISMIDFVLWKNKKLAKICLLVSITTGGLVMVIEDMFQSNYLLNEHWIIYILYLKYIGSFFFMKWTRIVFILYFIMICYALMLNYYFDKRPLKLYSAFSFVGILFPVSIYYGTKKIKEIIILLKINKDLIHTIRSILQVFPEGVIIQSIDPLTKQTVIKFANDVANQFLKQVNDSVEVSSELKVIPDSPAKNQKDQQLAEFLLGQVLLDNYTPSPVVGILLDRVYLLEIQARAGLGKTKRDLLWIQSFKRFCLGKTILDLPKSCLGLYFE